jgi:pyruvate/2-oxoglutarate dehydrogenase complex dihydrolipoamide dehydrogenase (E3) component
MPQPERFNVLHRLDVARSGQRTAVVERQRISGACPNIACMPTQK